MSRVLLAVGALAVVALTLLVVACGPDPAPTSPPAPTAPPAEARPTAPLAAEPTAPPTSPAPAPTARPAPTAAPAATAPTPEPTPEKPEEPDPSDAFFAMERVLEVSIEIAPEDWDTLRHQTRTFEDLMAEIEEYNLSRPFASIYDWFSATVTVSVDGVTTDGETYTDVGVRKKGFLGSQSDTKPSLKLRFDKYVDGQALGGVIERMTLNNSIQDPSMVNTCLAYQVFADAGNPAPRCNFATVTVNGKELGLYVHVEEIKAPMLARHFSSADGNLYEGTISDFTPEYRGTIEKKTNEDDDDWSDVDEVMSAVQDPSDAGFEALARLVDLDRFLSFWVTESLVGHWDGYTGDRNNYHFYREPDGKFVFIPWGVDDVFHLKDDPNPFDDISNPPPSVLALAAIPNRLYNIPDWQAKYAARMKEILDSVWNEEVLLGSVDAMAAIVQEHSLPEAKDAAAKDMERVRKFILKRKGEILADLTPEPPDWPEPELAGAVGELDLESFEVRFETTWGTNESANPLAEGTVYELNAAGEWVPTTLGEVGATAGAASPQEEADIGVENAALITAMGLYPDGTIQGVTFWLPVDRISAGAALTIGVDAGVGGAVWHIPSGGSEPQGFIPVPGGRIELTEAGTEPGAAIAGILYADFGDATQPSDRERTETDSAIGESFVVYLDFETAWGSKDSLDPTQVGMITYLAVDDYKEEITDEEMAQIGIIAGDASPEEAGILPGIADPASITYIVFEDDGSIEGATFVLSKERLTGGAVVHVADGELGGGVWSIPAGASAPDEFLPLTVGFLEVIEADTTPGALISARFTGRFGELSEGEASTNTRGSEGSGTPAFAVLDVGLVINELAAKGDPLDWFELHNTLSDPIALFGMVVADDLTDASKRVAFPDGTIIGPGEYLQFETDSDGWPGFALGSEEELGIWLADGTIVAMVGWVEGDSGEGESYARIPDATGDFQTVGNPTPGAANQP